MEIIFVRHAEKESEEGDPLLTNKGEQQAQFLAKRFGSLKIDAFYCSNLARAKQTAAIVSQLTSLSPTIQESLNEFDSKTIKSLRSSWSEEEETHYSNLVSFLDTLVSNPDQEKTILIIAHGITNRIILSHFFGVDLTRVISFTQSETGVNSMYWMPRFKNWRLRFWNDDNHLPLELKGNRSY